MHQGKVRLLGSLLAVIGIVGAACQPTAPAPSGSTGSSSGPAPSTPPQEIKLRVAITSIQSTMDPMASIGNNPRRYGMYELLVGQDENGKLIPQLATEWKNLDPLTWQFKLAQGRKFSDGNPVTAEDVKFSFDRATNPDLKLGIIARTATIASTTIVDAQTINIATKAADPLLLKRVALVDILEKAYVEKIGPADFALKGLGTGPYMQKEFVTNDHITMVPNPHHPVKPFASEVIIRQIPELSARVAGLRTGELDMIGGVSVDQGDSLKNQGFPLTLFNQGRSQGGFIFTNLPDNPATNNKLVRQAMNYAVDKESIVKNIFKGLTKPEAGQILQATTVGYNPNVKAYPFDQAKAKQLLAQAGYPNGFKMKILNYNTSPELTPTWLLVQNQFKDVGIEMEIEATTDSAFFLDRWYGRIARPNMLTVSLLNSPAMDGDFALVWFKGNGPDTNQRFYQNPAFDEAYTASTTELNEAKRTELLQKAVAAMNEDPPYLWMVEGFDIWAASPKVDGLIARGDQEPKFEIIKLK